MADIIQLLPESIANQIAAGEVIQRPASVVKELLENAVDAGSTFIQLVIKDSGKTLIQVVDDGKGMSETDARMSFERHATSKIREANDLFSIKTMGFRGEALASIASIAHVEMKTKPENQEMGTHLVIHGSVLKKQNVCPLNKGTTISIKNLFYNVPARRKFLKSDPVELRHIVEEFKRVALANPETSFTMVHNEMEVFHLNHGGMRKRIVGVFGKNFNEMLVPVEENTDIIKIKGYIGKPEIAKKNKKDQYLFVNHRFVKSNYLNHAIKLAFGDLIQKEDYPFYVINLDIDPAKIDINIHPTKTEIKFEEERLIYQYLKVTTQHALGKYNVVPTLDFQTTDRFNNIPHRNTSTPSQSAQTFKSNVNSESSKKDAQEINEWSQLYNEMGQEASNLYDEQQMLRIPSSLDKPSPRRSRNVDILETKKPYQIHNTFIISPIKSGYITIHQQHAHERILYEQYLEALDSQDATIQKQLFPINLHLNHEQTETMMLIIPTIQKMGFEIEHFGDHNFIINGIPALMQQVDISSMINELIEQYQANIELELGIHENVARSIAKSSCIKRGKPLTSEEMNSLISDLFSCEIPFISPGGKKCFIEVELNELEKQF